MYALITTSHKEAMYRYYNCIQDLMKEEAATQLILFPNSCPRSFKGHFC